MSEPYPRLARWTLYRNTKAEVNQVADGRILEAGEFIEVVPIARAEAAERRIAELEAEIERVRPKPIEEGNPDE